ncbi:MAG: ACT domain-containing protein, partial [Planctomycetes bacterium]|nr:ACT domain-containing protein [Planctomycetota bacterium]
IRGAALDVFEKEPLAQDHRLLRTPNLVVTPHLGASTKEAKRGVSLDMANQIATCLKRGVVLNGINVPRIAPSEATMVGPYLDLVHNLASFLVQVFPGRVQSLRLTLQGGVPESAASSLTVAMLSGALAHRLEGPVTPVNARRLAEQHQIRVHTESSSMKRDFMNLVRVEAVLDEQRHQISGTVLGQRHGRMVELDSFLLDAIPEGPALVTWHADRPGVLGELGTALGRHAINIARVQLAEHDGQALGILNLSQPLTDDAFAAVASLPGIAVARAVV